MTVEFVTTPLEALEADWVVVATGSEAPLDLDHPATWLQQRCAQLRELGDYLGKPQELCPLYHPREMRAPRLLLVGFGQVEDNRPTLQRALATATRHIAGKRGPNPPSIAMLPPAGNYPRLSLSEQVTELVVGALTGGFSQELFRAERARGPLGTMFIAVPDHVLETKRAALELAVHRGIVLSEAINQARQWVNLPPAEVNPATFADEARQLGQAHNLEITVLEPMDLAQQNMRCLLAVGAGSQIGARMLVARYRGAPDEVPPMAWVGKGITFDSGGLSLKTNDGMKDMKMDMAGAATALAALVAARRLHIPLNLMAVLPLAENLPSGTAYKLGDVLTAKNGKTIEVVNTDAEGRLVLADALCHTLDLGADRIVDLATLTGACMVALGPQVAGLMTNHQPWAEKVIAAASTMGERVWQLPMFPEYNEQIRSNIADMKNSGGRHGGAITGAKLLAEFVGTTPWVHLDIAGPAFNEKDTPYQDAGGTAFFLRSLVELAEREAQAPTIFTSVP